MNKQDIEREVKNRLDEALECFNENGSILSVEYDEETETVMVKFPIVKTEEKLPNGETYTNLTFNSY